MKTERCPTCNDPIRIGDWPMCKGKGSHESVFNLDAKRFDPVTYFRNIKTGERIIPPGNDVPPPPGFVTETANTLPEVRALTKHLDFQSKEKHYRYEHQRLNLKRQNVTANLEFAQRAREKMSDPTARAMTDRAISRMREQLRETPREFKPSGHFMAFEMDNIRQSR